MSQKPVGLGKAQPFAILAGSTITNTGQSRISGSLGLSPGSAVTGFPPGKVANGTIHKADVVARHAKAGLTTAYLDAAGRTPFKVVSKNLGGQKLSPGVYHSATSLGLTGTVTLNANGNANAVFIFQAGSTLLVAPSSTVRLTGGAQACNVFWQVGSSATLDSRATFAGTIMALTSASLKTGASVSGRVLARNGAVTLQDNTVTVPSCTTTTTTTTTTTASTTSTTSGGGGGGTTTSSPGPATVPGAHTGEPWAGWLYWALAGMLGVLGLASVERAVRIRRRRG